MEQQHSAIELTASPPIAAGQSSAPGYLPGRQPTLQSVLTEASAADHSQSSIHRDADPQAHSPRLQRLIYLLLALMSVTGMSWAMHRTWVPAHQGVDQNGYLYGGLQFAQNHSMAYVPADPYAYVGAMWVGTTNLGVYYPKYPLGLPFLYACMIWAGGLPAGLTWSYLVSPVCMAMAMVGAYLLMRRVLRPVESLLGMLVLMCSPVTLALWNNPNSHANCLVCVCWGMWFLTGWWQRGGLWRARMAGLLLGYAAAIRYSEGLLLLPILLAIAIPWPGVMWARGRSRDRGFQAKRCRQGDSLIDSPPAEPSHSQGTWQVGDAMDSGRPSAWSIAGRWRQGLVMLCWWALPLSIVVMFNMCWFGTLTGYDPTNESTGFALKYFVDNWDNALRQLNSTGLIFLMPVCLMGLVLMLIRRWRWGLMLLIWIVPNLLLYSFYYWAPDTTNVGYLRFFLTVFPGLVICGIGLISDLGRGVHLSDRAAGWCTASLAGLSAMIISGVLYPPVKIDADGMADPLWRVSAILCCIGAGGAVLLGVAMLMRWGQRRDRVRGGHRHEPVGQLLMLGLAGGTSACLCLLAALDLVQREYRQQLFLERSTSELLAVAKPGDMVMADMAMINHLQFVGDWHLYAIDAFNRSTILEAWKRYANFKEGDPDPRQMQRLELLAKLAEPMTVVQLQNVQQATMLRSIRAGHAVYLVGQQKVLDRTIKSMASRQLKTQVISQWNDASPVSELNRDRNQRLFSRVAAPSPQWVVIRMELMPPAPATQPTSATRTATNPATTRPAATRPATTVPAATRPAVTRPATTNTVTTNPSAAQPITTLPAVTRPAAAPPATTRTSPSSPSTSPGTLPANVQSPANQPTSATRAVTNPATTSQPATQRAATTQPIRSVP